VFDIYKFLEDNKIFFQRFDHPAVYTCEEAERLCPPMPGVPLKNLFLRDGKGEKHFLVIVGYEKSADLKALKDLLGVSKLGFASAERLQKYLGVEPGSVTVLGLINDTEHAVEVFIDKSLWGQDFQAHPLVNIATLVINNEGIKKFFEATGHEYKIIDVPGR
jgi:Ala-tRNA(Pro) deacylase